MSEQQIQEILRRLDSQDTVIKEIVEQNKRQFQMLEPLYKIFTNATGFGSISIVILKTLVLIGAGFGVVYAAIKWLKQ